MSENPKSEILSQETNGNNRPKGSKGIVVTISRQKGCGAFALSNMLIDRLNKLDYPEEMPKWKLISKEILEHSADQLKVEKSEVNSIVNMNVINKLFMSFSQKSLPKDIQIKNTIREVIENAGKQGNVVIIGRGGVSITRNMEHSLHIDLVAPYTWRVKQISVQENISVQEAEKRVTERDKQRDSFKQYFLGVKELDIHLYDFVINVATMTQSEIVDMLFSVVKSRQEALVKGH